MSRSGYSEDCDGWALIRWRGAVTAATKGRRGQAFLVEMLAALDALPDKRLSADLLLDGDNCCAMGAVAKARGIDVSPAAVDAYDRAAVAQIFDIAPALAAEIAYINDDGWRLANDNERWGRVRAWVVSQLEKPQ